MRPRRSTRSSGACSSFWPARLELPLVFVSSLSLLAARAPGSGHPAPRSALARPSRPPPCRSPPCCRGCGGWAAVVWSGRLPCVLHPCSSRCATSCRRPRSSSPPAQARRPEEGVRAPHSGPRRAGCGQQDRHHLNRCRLFLHLQIRLLLPPSVVAPRASAFGCRRCPLRCNACCIGRQNVIGGGSADRSPIVSNSNSRMQRPLASRLCVVQAGALRSRRAGGGRAQLLPQRPGCCRRTQPAAQRGAPELCGRAAANQALCAPGAPAECEKAVLALACYHSCRSGLGARESLPHAPLGLALGGFAMCAPPQGVMPPMMTLLIRLLIYFCLN